MTLKCQLLVSSDYEHLRQLYTGFLLLHKHGVIEASQSIAKIPLGKYQETHLKVVVNDEITVYFDMHDCGDVLPEYLAEADFYFKRSYSPAAIKDLAGREKVFPFGFNYLVNAGEFDKFLLQRRALHRGGEYYKAIFHAIGAMKVLGKETSTLQMLEAEPDLAVEPRVIFMARAWDTGKIENKAQIELTNEINRNRAECIRALRREFGERFFGGLAVDDYSQKYFADVLLPNETISTQRDYLKVLKNHPICVATMGLCRSNGWKIAEYVALSKAIVSERLQYEVAGDFAENTNYLEFSTPQEAVAQCVELYENTEKRNAMMRANREYYLNYLQPEQIILNSLRVARPSLL